MSKSQASGKIKKKSQFKVKIDTKIISCFWLSQYKFGAEKCFLIVEMSVAVIQFIMAAIK